MFEASAATTELWTKRVSAWRASGERAEAFSRGGGYAANTLRWWACKLKRDQAALAAPEFRIARIVRGPTVPDTASTTQGHAITLEIMQTGVRIGIAAGADRATLAMVLDVLRAGDSR